MVYHIRNMKIFTAISNFANSLLIKTVYAQGPTGNTSINLNFKPPSLADLIGFLIKAFFVIAGVAALLFLLLGALAWVTSGRDKENVKKAQEKIQAAVVGLLVIVAVLAIMVTLEQIIFKGALCIGLTCPITIPSLIQVTPTPP